MKHFQHMTMTWKSKKVRSTENQQNLPKTPHASGLGLDRCQVLQRLGNKKTNRTWASNSCWWYFCSLGYIWVENFNVFAMILSSSTWWLQPTRQIGSFPPSGRRQVLCLIHEVSCLTLDLYMYMDARRATESHVSMSAYAAHLPLCRLSKPHLYVKSSNAAYINTYMCLYTCNL